jgi:hypothetical protein
MNSLLRYLTLSFMFRNFIFVLLALFGMINITASGQPPVAPVANAGTNITGTSFTASWLSVSNAYGYFMDVSKNNTFTLLVTNFNNVSVSGTSISVTGLTIGTTYYYRVRAFNGTYGVQLLQPQFRLLHQ